MTKTVNINTRDQDIAQKALAGVHYNEIAKQCGISSRTVYRVLEKDAIKDIIDTGFQMMVSNIPLAVDVVNKTLTDKEEPALRYKAAQDVLKMGAIIPSNVQNQTIYNIQNQQNNLVTPETMHLVKRILPGFEPTDVVKPEKSKRYRRTDEPTGGGDAETL